MMTDIQANKSWMIKELRGERLSDNADTTLFFICVILCSVSAGGEKSTKKMLCYWVNSKDTIQYGQGKNR